MSIRTCPTCGTDVDVSNGLLGCPACGRSLAAAPVADEVPTSILQFFDDVEPDGRSRPVDRHPDPAMPGEDLPRSAAETQELPVVPALPRHSPAPSQPVSAGSAPTPDDPSGSAATSGRLLFDDLSPGTSALARDEGTGRGRGGLGGARGRLPGGLLLIGAFAAGGLAVLAAFALRGGPDPATAASAPARSSAPAASTSPSSASPAPSASPTAPADPAAVARGIEGLLVRSDEARGTLNSATGPLGTCRIDPAGAASTIQSVVDERQRILADLQALPGAQVAALPSGEQLVGALASAMQASIAADQAYVQWADDAQGCTPGQAPPAQALREGNQLSRSAQSAKGIFVTLWNPIAEKYGLPTRTANDV
ncbi:MAG: hypothetical protein ACTHOD_01690 [Motilibacteraceae bacterium]